MSYIEKCGLRFLDNNMLEDTANVVVTAETDFNGNTYQDVLDKRNYGNYRLTKDPVKDAFIIDIELKAPLSPTSFAMVPKNINNFFLSSESTVEIQASNFGFDTTQETFTGKLSRFGVFVNLVKDQMDPYRYYRVSIPFGNLGAGWTGENLDIKYMFFGDGVYRENVNIATGFSVTYEDLSEIFQAESGREYPNEKEFRTSFNGLRFQFMEGQDKINFQKFFQCAGIKKNFLVVVDPDFNIESDPNEYMRIMRFQNMPSQAHIIRKLFEHPFTLREAM